MTFTRNQVVLSYFVEAKGNNIYNSCSCLYFRICYCTHSYGHVASFPGLHAQLLSLAVRKAGEGLDGLIT